ncbi:MAG: acyl-CoA dehydrogenase family protein [Thermodesulfobacteriota bacterium]
MTDRIRFGLHSPEPDLLEVAPMLRKWRERFPDYIDGAVQARAQARRIAREIVLPGSLELDQRCAADPAYADWDLWRRLNKEKLGICILPKKIGGLGWSILGLFAALEEMVAADVSTTAFLMFNLFGPVCAFVEFAPEVCLPLLRDLVSAQSEERPLFFAWALTEPNCGTDNLNEDALATQRPSVSVKRTEGGYIVNGVKHFISNGSHAHHIVLVLPTDSERPRETFSVFHVPSSAKGFSVGRIEKKMGHRAKHTAEILFKDVFVPDRDVWEQPGRGWRHTMEVLAISTGAVGMLGVGLARGALERCISYCCNTRAGGKRLIDENWVRIEIAGMLSQIMAVRAKCLDFAVGADAMLATSLLEKPLVKAALGIVPAGLLLSEPLSALASHKNLSALVRQFKHSCVPDETVAYFKGQGGAVKVAGTDLCVDVSARVLDIVGLDGAAHEHGMEKVFRDAKVTQIYEGTNQVNLLGLFQEEIARRAGI